MGAMTSEAVTIPRETAVEMLAAIDAAQALWNLADGEEIDMFFGELRERLMIEVFGRYSSDEDDSWQRDAHVVEINARSNEIEADALELSPAGWSFEMTIDEHAALVARLREHAEEMREQGTINVPFEKEER